MADLLKLADSLKFSRKFEKCSLGQGQGPKAEKLLTMAIERGYQLANFLVQAMFSIKRKKK